MNRSSFAVALLSGVSAVAMCTGAFAQTTSTANEVVVTGSRVIQNGNNSPTPVTVVSTQQIMDLQPTTIADALDNLPEFVGSQNQSSSPGNSGGNSAAANLNLRDVGANRTLILYDGHRVAPTSSGGNVDVNQIPQLLLQRVDVVTGGASAVYGSDAVAGVVNFITDTKFNGFKMNLRTGVSTYGDDKTFDGSGAWGKTFLDGKAHFEASYEYLDDPGIFSKLSRPWGSEVYAQTGSGTPTSPYTLISNARLSNTSFNGVITSGPLNGLEFQQNGVASPFVNGAATGTQNVQSGGDGGYYSTASLKSLQVEHQAFARLDYDFTDSVHGYAQFAGTLVRNENNHQTNEVRGSQTYGVLGDNNAYLQGLALPTGYANPYSANDTTDSFQIGKMMLQAPSLQPETFESNYMFITGLDGSFDNYKWNLGYEHTYDTQHTRNNANMNVGHLLAAENAVIGPNGTPVCHAALVNPAYANCVPLDLFGPTSESAAALKYVLQVTDFWSRNIFDDVSGSFTGAPVSTWAGPVNMAVSGEWRNLRYDLTSDAQPTDHPDCYGIQFNCTAGTSLWFSNVAANRSPVTQSVWEVAYETDIPLAKDLPLMQALNLNGAIRYTDYSNSGGVDTWKVGLDWHINNDFTVRATRSKDIRAPNLNDLYAPTSISPNGFSDLHTGITGQVAQYSQGNPNLKPEDADTTTAGVVWAPHYIPRFSVSLDAYRITLNNAINGVNSNGPQVQQLCENSGGTSVYCSLYVRPYAFSDHSADNFPTAVLGESLNIAYIDTYGADLETNYATKILDHNASFRGFVSYSPHLVYNLGPGGIIDMGDAANGQGSPHPSWKMTVMASFDVTDKFKVQVSDRWRNSLAQSGVSSQVYTTPPVPAVSYTDMNLSYDLDSSVGKTQLYLNISNIFNQQPPTFAQGGAASVPGLFGGYVQGDDNIGRYFTVGLHFRH